MPKVKDITSEILNGEYHFHGDNRIYTQPNPGKTKYDERDSDVIRLTLDTLKNHIQDLKVSEDVNYEEITYIVSKLKKQSGTSRDPTLQVFRDVLFTELKTKFSKKFELTSSGRDTSTTPPKVTLDNVISSTWTWIMWIVFEQLIDRNKQHSPKALRDFFDVMLDSSKIPTICTLNHDTKTEQALGSYPYVDGFSSSTSGTAKFHPSLLKSREGQIPLLKLHGSINWFCKDGEYIKLVNPDDYDDANCVFEPLFLAGSLNKLEDYSYLMFPWIWTEFQNQLLQTKRIICSGYGFMDLGVTSRLREWLSLIYGAKLLIIDPDPEKLVQSCQRHGINNIGSFFGERESQTKYTICVDSTKIQDTRHSIIFLKCGFEDASKHAKALRTFAYGTT